MRWKFENSDGSTYYVREFETVTRAIAWAKALSSLSGDTVTMYRESLLADRAIGDREHWHRYGYTFANTFRRFKV